MSDQSLKILCFFPTVGRGGVRLVCETLTRKFAELAEQKNIEFTILGQTYDENDVKINYPKSWKLIQLDPMAHLPRHPYQFQFLRDNYKTFLNHLVRVQDQYDLIFTLSPWWIMYADYWPVTKPFVTVIPDFAFDFIEMGTLARHFRQASLLIAQRATATIFPAEFTRQHGINRYKFDKNKTKTIPHSIDFVAKDYYPTIEEADRVRYKYSLPKEYILAFHCFGHKSPETILRAQLKARSTSPNVPPLVIAGIETERYLTNNSDEHAQGIREIIRQIKANIGTDLFILGEVPDEDVAGLFKGASAAIFASKSEGDISGGMLNAIAAKTPLLYADLPVFHSRLGTEQQYGLTFPIENDYRAGLALCDICDHPKEAKTRAQAVYDLLEGYTVIDVANAYLKVFRSAVAGEIIK